MSPRKKGSQSRQGGGGTPLLRLARTSEVREQTPPTPTVINHSRPDLSNYLPLNHRISTFAGNDVPLLDIDKTSPAQPFIICQNASNQMGTCPLQQTWRTRPSTLAGAATVVDTPHQVAPLALGQLFELLPRPTVCQFCSVVFSGRWCSTGYREGGSFVPLEPFPYRSLCRPPIVVFNLHGYVSQFGETKRGAKQAHRNGLNISQISQEQCRSRVDPKARSPGLNGA
ncbi:hypothetical protein J6590_037598 [Homalodisca vitripennis]|nr:hypothetical protein J6590_037598 [Homalodisca vitripennis]